jgi:E3 ubiquitin-protein ligase UBR1
VSRALHKWVLLADDRCGMGVGMFVDIKRWVLLYLYAGSGSFSHMPYLDSHGELDLSMRWVCAEWQRPDADSRRGHRQMLQEGRWEELRRTVWLQHTIPHLTARRLELTSDGGGWTSL